jgi:hypothetical protein
LPTNISAESEPLLSWRVAILPFVDQGELYKKFKLDEPWDSEHNRALLNQLPPVFRDPRVADPTHTTYQVFAGKEAFFNDEPPKVVRILDGTSNTLLAIQSPPEQAVPWTKPQDLPFDPKDAVRALGKVPADGIFGVMFDGSVYKLPAVYPGEAWRRLIQPDDGGVVELPGR